MINDYEFKNTFLKEALANLSNLTRLETNTLVGKYTFNNVEGVKTTIVTESTEDRMCSQINLVTGDITTAILGKQRLGARRSMKIDQIEAARREVGVVVALEA